MFRFNEYRAVKAISENAREQIDNTKSILARLCNRLGMAGTLEKVFEIGVNGGRPEVTKVLVDSATLGQLLIQGGLVSDPVQAAQTAARITNVVSTGIRSSNDIAMSNYDAEDGPIPPEKEAMYLADKGRRKRPETPLA